MMGERYLFLTSDGLSNDMKQKFWDIIGKQPQNTKVLYIPTAGIKTDGAREGIAVCLYELSLMGIPDDNIFVYNLELILSKDYKKTYSSYFKNPSIITRLLTTEELREFDAVFVGGGDCLILCSEMARTGFENELRKAVDNGLVYVGISAGSMYAAGNSVECLHIIDNPIIPHWNGIQSMELPCDNGEIKLADGQTIYIENDRIRLLSIK